MKIQVDGVSGSRANQMKVAQRNVQQLILLSLPLPTLDGMMCTVLTRGHISAKLLLLTLVSYTTCGHLLRSRVHIKQNDTNVVPPVDISLDPGCI